MPKLVVDIPNEVAEFMDRHHVTNVNLIQAGYDILKVIYGERKIEDKGALAKVSFAMYGHYDAIERMRKQAESYGYRLERDPSLKGVVTVE